MINNQLFQNTLEQHQIGLWQLGDETNDQWSKHLLYQLGLYGTNVIPSLEYFVKNLLHSEDINVFKVCYEKYKKEGLNFKNEIKIKVLNEFVSFLCFSTNEAPITINSDKRLIFFQKVAYSDEKKNPFNFKENPPIVKIGHWFINFKNKESHWDIAAKSIFGYEKEYSPSLTNPFKYYAPDYRKQASDTFLSCSITGKPFKSEIKILTKQGEEIWVNSIGKAIRDDKNEIIGIKGVFQDIDEIKKRELTLKNSLQQVSSQNDRLFNFAHIVSHNLRSHSSNLNLLVQLIESIEDKNEKLDLLKEVKTIGTSLGTTIEHLTEIVSIHTHEKGSKTKILFSESIFIVTSSINHIISKNKAKISIDFKEQNSITYVPAYMESILLNLITNSIKYKHAERDPYISIKTGLTELGKTYMKFTDNGQGIDMDKFGEDVFGMYKTFHYNSDAVGIGLFITKNQIESLGGTIDVESTINVGTTFTIIF